MAFEIIETAGFPEHDILPFEGGTTVLVLLGSDAQSGINVFADLSLTPLPGGGRHEFTFHIITRDVDTGEEVAYWNGVDTQCFFDGQQRKKVLEFVLIGAAVIIRQLRPERVQIITHQPDLPEQALLKYQLLINVFHSLGYKITVCDPYHGRRLWWAELAPE